MFGRVQRSPNGPGAGRRAAPGDRQAGGHESRHGRPETQGRPGPPPHHGRRRVSVQKRPNGKYLARVREYKGGPERSKQFDRRMDAQSWEAETKVALARGTYLTADQSRETLSAYVEAYLGRQSWRDRTFDLARGSLGRAVAYFGAGRPVAGIRRGDVEAYVVALSTKMAPGTVRTTFQHFRAVMCSALADGLVTVDPTIRIRLA